MDESIYPIWRKNTQKNGRVFASLLHRLIARFRLACSFFEKSMTPFELLCDDLRTIPINVMACGGPRRTFHFKTDDKRICVCARGCLGCNCLGCRHVTVGKRNLENNTASWSLDWIFGQARDIFNLFKGLLNVFLFKPFISLNSKYNIKTFYKPFTKLKDIFGLPKNPIKPSRRCDGVYKVSRDDCDKIYVGKMGNSLDTRVRQHKAACRQF